MKEAYQVLLNTHKSDGFSVLRKAQGSHSAAECLSNTLPLYLVVLLYLLHGKGHTS